MHGPNLVIIDSNLQYQKHDLDPSRSDQSRTAKYTRSMQTEKQQDCQLHETGKESNLNSADH